MTPPADAPTRRRQGSFLHDFFPAALLLVIGLTALLGASLSGDGRSGQYLVIGAPWSGHGRMIDVIRHADGGLAGVGGFGNIAIASSQRSDFAARARRAGAWLALPSPRIAGCFGLQSEAHP
ncbi:hypothetical protein [Novosphingobium rosa]|uniref:hypothetical protein n=1 Tax=Novosphingobium rosa TaxID=76978 RepID=UPI00082F124A|nr:hypothetical protein [Novosphingobium rosa]